MALLKQTASDCGKVHILALIKKSSASQSLFECYGDSVQGSRELSLAHANHPPFAEGLSMKGCSSIADSTQIISCLRTVKRREIGENTTAQFPPAKDAYASLCMDDPLGLTPHSGNRTLGIDTDAENQNSFRGDAAVINFDQVAAVVSSLGRLQLPSGILVGTYPSD